VSAWIGRRLVEPGHYDPAGDEPLRRRSAWPRAAWGVDGERYVATVSAWPCHERHEPLESFLQFEPAPLSPRAAAGFYSRALKAKLRFLPGFLDIVQRHLDAR
jgi:DNA (cytosine-5)-methyltransferase 1